MGKVQANSREKPELASNPAALQAIFDALDSIDKKARLRPSFFENTNLGNFPEPTLAPRVQS